MKERYERLEETLQLAHRMWAGDATPFEGVHYRLENPFNNPNSIQRPHPPILVGGSGERKTLRLVAQYADACNLFDIPEGVVIAGTPGGLGSLKHKLEVLRGHCEAVGRSYEAIEKTVTSSFAISPTGNGSGAVKGPAEIIDHFGALAEVGLEHVVFEPSSPWDEESLNLIASLLPEIERL